MKALCFAWLFLVLVLPPVSHAGDPGAVSAARAAEEGAGARAKSPNVVIILADDLGYGDVHALNSASGIPTPSLDGLAEAGMTFTDAHSPSAVCTPTRYGLLTGRYCWRTRLRRGVLGGYSPPLIAEDRPTIASLLADAGYRTAGVGKWHLGMRMPMKAGRDAGGAPWHGDPGVDWGGRIEDGPTTRGFHEYFGVSASLDMAPYVWIHDDGFHTEPSLQQERLGFPHFVRSGPRAEDFVLDEVLDRLVREARAFIECRAPKSSPYFLYLALTAPHKPAWPHERFRGKTGLGEYGDFVTQVDWTVGQILEAVDDSGEADDTLVLFSSDNGSYMHRYDDPARKDHVDDPEVQGYRAGRHRANGPFRGTKADIWEAGHHVPLFARWPGTVEAGTRCDETVCLTDLFATCAEVAGVEIGRDAGEDSVSLLPLLRGEDRERGAPVIHHSVRGMFAIRDGRWKLVLGNGSGGRERPRGKPFGKPYRLFDLSRDIGETTNRIEEHPEVAERLEARFEEIRRQGRSVERDGRAPPPSGR